MNNRVQKLPNGDFKVMPEQETPGNSPVTIENGKRIFHSEAFYLDWCNNFLSVEAMADYYMIEVSHAENLINWGRILNHERNGIKTMRQIINEKISS